MALASNGPAGLEISPCEYRLEGQRLFLLIPGTSEHLVNIELNPQVAITLDHWRLVGIASAVNDQKFYQAGEGCFENLLEVLPSRFEFLTPDTNQVIETIDIAEEDWVS